MIRAELLLKLVLEHGLEDYTEWKVFKEISMINRNILDHASNERRLQKLKLKILGEEQRTFHENGTLHSHFFTKNALNEGRCIIKEKKNTEVSFFRRGRKNGESRRYFMSTLVEHCFFKEGVLHGRYLKYELNPVTKVFEVTKNLNYDHGKTYGFKTFRRYDVNEQKSFFINSKLRAQFIRYDQSGVTECWTFDSNGKLCYSVTLSKTGERIDEGVAIDNKFYKSSFNKDNSIKALTKKEDPIFSAGESFRVTSLRNKKQFVSDPRETLLKKRKRDN